MLIKSLLIKTVPFQKLLALVALTMLVGCAHTVKRQAFNKEASGNMKTLALAKPSNQDIYEAIVLGHPGVSFGLIGGLIAAADMQAKSNQLTAAIDPNETRLQERFVSKLSTQLISNGYDVKLVPISKETAETDIVDTVKRSTSSDGILSVTIRGQYVAAGPTTDYFPYIRVQIKNVDPKSGDTLYEDTLTYGYTQPNAQTVHFTADPSYRFADVSALVADPSKTREGLIVGIDAIAGQIASDLRKN